MLDWLARHVLHKTDYHAPINRDPLSSNPEHAQSVYHKIHYLANFEQRVIPMLALPLLISGD